MTSPSGIIFNGLITNAGYSEQVFQFTTNIWVATMIIPIVVISGTIIYNRKSNKMEQAIEMDKPDKFEPKQRTNLNLIIAMVVIILSAPILHLVFPSNEIITLINSKMDVGLVAIILAVVASFLKLADEKQVIAKVPWNTLIMICGVGMLIAVAIKAGTIDLLASWVGTNIPIALIPISMCVIAGIMSFFSSTLGVVCPALFPIVPAIVAATGLNPMALFTCIVIGAQATSFSPFSSGGAMILSSCPNEDERTKLFPRLMFFCVPGCLAVSVITSIIISLIY